MKSMNRFLSLIGIVALCLMFMQQLSAKQNIGTPIPGSVDHSKELMKKGSGCAPATAQRELAVNNVRTRILNGGDLWWDLASAKYEIPKVQPGQVSKCSIFSGALWIGGVTNGNLRIAAQTYRQSGNDYFPGPLSNGTASIGIDRCLHFDKIWSVQLVDINNFTNDPTIWSNNQSDDIHTWPTTGDVSLGEANYLAPFFDANKNGIYEPNKGEYPTFDQDQIKNIPDQMMWWVYNDKGNIHSETSGVPIGLEFQEQAFAFSTNDEINNMTFYRTKITNRSTEKIDSCVFGQWVDPDLGNYADDYVECDVQRNLGICYNGEDNDPGPLGYGLNPPSVGVNFFQGPKRPDGTEIGLTKFVYYNNDWSTQGNPRKPSDYWGYLNGRWTDGSPITYGGNGKTGTDTASFMFPGLTDPAGRTNWTEVTAGNTPGDRRFLQTAGSFTLLPGAVNDVTIGVVWARATSGGARGSFNLLKLASDKAYALFKNNFNLIQGPSAPTLQITELNKKLLFTITNTADIENFSDSFAGGCTSYRTKYKFQGYQVFQLKINSIPGDFYDLSQAQLVAQFDIVDGVNRIINETYDPALSSNVKKIMVDGNNAGIQHSFQIEKDFFQTGTDQSLVNFQNYYYVILSYASAVNCVFDALQYLPSSKTFKQSSLVVYPATPHDPAPRGDGTQINSDFGDGIPVTQIEGIGNGGNYIQLTQESINEAILASNGYRSVQRRYMKGASPVYIKVINPLAVPQGEFKLWMKDISTSTLKEDTLTAASTKWYIRNENGELDSSVQSISNPNEQIFPKWGISVNISQCVQPGVSYSLVDQSNGFISSSITYANPTGKKWLQGVVDEDQTYMSYIPNQINWIRSGATGKGLNPAYLFSKDNLNSDFADLVHKDPNTGGIIGADPRKNFSKIINSTWSPYCLANRYTPASFSGLPKTELGSFGPAFELQYGVPNKDNLLSDLQSVQIFITSDKSKWSRCVVLESGEDAFQNIGGASKLDIRISQSVDKNGNYALVGSGVSTNSEAANYISETGMGWFPGYAISVETGERLNILFAEDSSLPTENGIDMLWNPSANVLAYKSGQFRPLFGGKHFIYVMGVKKFALSGGNIRYTPTRYDECRNYRALLGDLTTSTDAGGNIKAGNTTNPSPQAYKIRKQMFFSQVLYTSIPTASPNSLYSPTVGLIPNDVTININVKKPYASYSMYGDTILNKGLPYFSFNTTNYAPLTGKDLAVKAMDMVSVVPNPYYAFSIYEDAGNALDTRIKIINLPKKCQLNIYTLDGTLVRRISKDDDTRTYIEWDLKNDAKVPIVSGVYLIDIKDSKTGEERVIKWVGVMRPADYDSF